MRPSDPTTLQRPLAPGREAPSDAAEADPLHAGPRPEPREERLRGPGLVLLWGVLIAGSWALVAGLGYGAWRLIVAAW
ncbi:hypothetical protein [Azospirillum sp.]|uniref:hypothetical protein n=1 Tax=Azospirillum sp. TaxID=34012 RepID=UPI002D3A78FA|nr:hypothetical protein [Azospirillum sp.]HYD66945.1 hypothetical protein [Azospirillum sp.]